MADTPPASKLYLFKGAQYLKVDPATMLIEGQPGSIGDWSGLAGALNDGQEVDRIDAVTYLPDTASQHPATVLFLKADKYCIFDPQKDVVTASGMIADLFKNLHKDTDVDFTRDIDAAISDTAANGYMQWFKGSYNAYSALKSLDDFGNTHRPISAWMTSSYPYTMGVQASIAYANDYYLFRGDSWSTHSTGKSITVETLIPGSRALGFDDELDDILIAPFDKKMPVSADSFPASAGTVLTVTVLNNLATDVTVTVAMEGGPTDTIPAAATQETHKSYTVTGAGQVSIAVAGNNQAMRLSPSVQTVGGGYCRYIGAEQKAAGVYTDVVVVVTWPSKVT